MFVFMQVVSKSNVNSYSMMVTDRTL